MDHKSIYVTVPIKTYDDLLDIDFGTPISDLLSCEAMAQALVSAVENARREAPDDHDVLVSVGNVLIEKVSFIHPHAIVFEGLENGAERTRIVAHFSQVFAIIAVRPKQGERRVVTGFSAVQPKGDSREPEMPIS